MESEGWARANHYDSKDSKPGRRAMLKIESNEPKYDHTASAGF